MPTLNWIGKEAVVNHHREVPYHLLRCDKKLSVGEPVNVDLVQTFNWLLGLRLQHMNAIRGFRVVEGENPKGEKVLVIWRNLKETSNEDLEEFFKKQQYNTLDMEFDLVSTSTATTT